MSEYDIDSFVSDYPGVEPYAAPLFHDFALQHANNNGDTLEHGSTQTSICLSRDNERNQQEKGEMETQEPWSVTVCEIEADQTPPIVKCVRFSDQSPEQGPDPVLDPHKTYERTTGTRFIPTEAPDSTRKHAASYLLDGGDTSSDDEDSWDDNDWSSSSSFSSPSSSSGEEEDGDKQQRQRKNRSRALDTVQPSCPRRSLSLVGHDMRSNMPSHSEVVQAFVDYTVEIGMAIGMNMKGTINFGVARSLNILGAGSHPSCMGEDIDVIAHILKHDHRCPEGVPHPPESQRTMMQQLYQLFGLKNSEALRYLEPWARGYPFVTAGGGSQQQPLAAFLSDDEYERRLLRVDASLLFSLAEFIPIFGPECDLIARGPAKARKYHISAGNLTLGIPISPPMNHDLVRKRRFFDGHCLRTGQDVVAPGTTIEFHIDCNLTPFRFVKLLFTCPD